MTSYKDGNLVGSLSYPATNTVVNLDIECVSRANVNDWTVKANGVEASSAFYNGTSTTFQINGVPLTSAWAKVKLEDQEPVCKDTQGWCEWGKYQPTNDHELQFTVEPATQAGEGVFPVSAVTNTAYDYDPAGQVITNSGTGGWPVVYAYDSARNMIRCWSGTTFTNIYHYDHARRLIGQVTLNNGIISSNRYIYNGMDMIAKVDEISGEIVYFTRGPGIAPGVGDVLAETHILGGSTTTHIYVQNHRGDTVALVTNGFVAAKYEYSAWGQVTSHTGAEAWFTFSGKHYDADAGLYYYGFRWYNAVAKRWTQPDPLGLAEGLDLYQFCGNDSMHKCDTYGERWYHVIVPAWYLSNKTAIEATRWLNPLSPWADAANEYLLRNTAFNHWVAFDRDLFGKSACPDPNNWGQMTDEELANLVRQQAAKNIEGKLGGFSIAAFEALAAGVGFDTSRFYDYIVNYDSLDIPTLYKNNQADLVYFNYHSRTVLGNHMNYAYFGYGTEATGMRQAGLAFTAFYKTVCAIPLSVECLPPEANTDPLMLPVQLKVDFDHRATDLLNWDVIYFQVWGVLNPNLEQR